MQLFLFLRLFFIQIQSQLDLIMNNLVIKKSQMQITQPFFKRMFAKRLFLLHKILTLYH